SIGGLSPFDAAWAIGQRRCALSSSEQELLARVLERGRQLRRRRRWAFRATAAAAAATCGLASLAAVSVSGPPGRRIVRSVASPSADVQPTTTLPQTIPPTTAAS